jgi:hypothetical protein
LFVFSCPPFPAALLPAPGARSPFSLLHLVVFCFPLVTLFLLRSFSFLPPLPLLRPVATYKYLQEIMACKVSKSVHGQVTHLALADDHDAPETATLAIAWGQNAPYGELGLGVGQPKSATKPVKVEPLDKLKLLDVAAGA